MIVNKKCADCGKDFEYDEKPGFPRKYCFSCGAKRKASFESKQDVPQYSGNVPVVRPGEPVKTNSSVSSNKIKAPTGEYQSLVYNKTLSANSYEVGKSGNRFKLYFETIKELQEKLKELKEAGLMDEEVNFE